MPNNTRIERITILFHDSDVVNEIKGWLNPYSLLVQLDTFNSLRVAVPLLAKSPSGLMLVSDRFPEASGLSLYAGLRKLSPKAQVYMLASEETPMPEMVSVAQREANLLYFPQPWDQRSLLANLEASLGNETPVYTTAVILDGAQHQEVSRHLDELQESVAALSIYLTTDLGQILAYAGDDELTQIGEISSLLGGSFAALQQVGYTLGDFSPAYSLIQRQSDTGNLYVFGVGNRALLVLLFSRGHNTPRIGTVAYYARNKVEALAKILASNHDQQASQLVVAGMEEALTAEFDTLFAKSGEDIKKDNQSSERLLDVAKAFEEGLVTKGLLDRFRAAGGRSDDSG